MKKISTLFLMVAISLGLFAQKDATQKEVAKQTAGAIAPTTEEGEKAWKFGGGVGLFASQVQLVNWAAGGKSSISGAVAGDIFANYRRGKHSWENNFKAEWGMIKNEGEPISKNKDMWELNSKYGYQIDKKGTVFVGGLMNLTSQFTLTHAPESKSVYVSNFFAPARLTLAAGLDWKPNEMFSLFFSPAAGKFTFVLDNGVDETTYGLTAGAKVRTEFGAYLRAEFKKELIKNVKFRTTLSLYNNYIDNSRDSVYVVTDQGAGKWTTKSNRGNIDVDWTVGIDLVVNKWITVNFATQLLYDHDVKITREVDGVKKTGPTTQFSETLNVGFTYRFVPKEDRKKK